MFCDESAPCGRGDGGIHYFRPSGGKCRAPAGVEMALVLAFYEAPPTRRPPAGVEMAKIMEIDQSAPTQSIAAIVAQWH